MNISTIISRMALAGAMTMGALTASAEDPIITFHTNVYDNVGETNAFHFYLGAKEPIYVDVDCGFGSIETEVGVAVFDPEAGGIAGTAISCTVSQEGIVKIYGDASKIDYIDMEGCYISEISFPQLTEVEILNLSYNELKGLDLSHMSKLQALYLGSNPFSETPLLIGPDKPDLTILSLDIIDNLDPSFDMADYPALRSFEAWHVPTLTRIDPTNCPNLLQLSIDLTNVESIDISKNPNLLILNVADTKITELDLSNNPYLTELYCGHMAAGYGQYAMTSLNLGSKPNLQRLFCQGNALTTLDVSGCPKLTDLSCSYNYLTELSLDANKELVNLNIAMNLFTFATLPDQRDTFNEYYYYQRPMSIDRSYAVGTTLDFSQQVLREGSTTKGYLYKVSEESPNFPELLEDEYYTYADGKITLNKALTDSVQVSFTNDLFAEYPLSTSKFMVKTASEIGKPSPVVELTFYPTVKDIALSVGMQGASAESPLHFKVDFGNGQLVDFTAVSSGLPETPNVTGTRTGHVTIYMPENTDISAFGIDGQRLMSADVSRAKTLERLAITDCQLSAIDLKWNRCLSSLDLSGNNLSTIDLSEPNGSYGKNVLSDFKAARNRLTEVVFSTRTCLQSLDLSDNDLAALDLLKFSALTYLDLSGNQLTEVDLRDLESIVTMNLSGNNLSEISLLDYLPLESLNISGNYFTFATLPAPGAVTEYIYAPQAPVSLPAKAPSINLSDNYVEIDGAVTQYDWVMNATGAPVPAGAVTSTGNGLFRFADPDLGEVRCEMTHAAFPDFKGAAVYTTTPVQTASMPTYVFAAFTTLEDGVAELTMRSTKPDVGVYIDWEGNGYLEQYVLTDKPLSFEVKTKAGADVKCYSYDEDNCVDVFSFGGAKLASIDASRMMNLVNFTCANSGLKLQNISLPLCKETLEELSLAGNEIESIDLSDYTALRMLNLSENKLTEFDSSPFKKLEVLYLAYNNLTSVKLDNALLWETVLIGNKLEDIDLSHIPTMQQLFLSDNLLTHLDVSAMPRLKDLFIDQNYFTFATLPVISINRYVYANQAMLTVTPEDGYIVDLSSQVTCQGTPTVYTWYIDSPYYDEDGSLVGENLYEGDEYEISGGVTTFLKPFTHIMCVMTNTRLPNIVLYTDFIDVNPKQDGIEEIASVSDSLPARWYDLSGACVAETVAGERPSLKSGIYVRLTSQGASKVLVR